MPEQNIEEQNSTQDVVDNTTPENSTVDITNEPIVDTQDKNTGSTQIGDDTDLATHTMGDDMLVGYEDMPKEQKIKLRMQRDVENDAISESIDMAMTSPSKESVLYDKDISQINTIGDYMNYQASVITPAKNAWKDSPDVQKKYIKLSGGDEVEAQENFYRDYKNYLKKSLDKNQDDRIKLAIDPEFAILTGLDTLDDVVSKNFDAVAVSEWNSLGGSRRLGKEFVGDQTQSARWGAVKGNLGFINDKDILVKLDVGDKFLDGVFGGGNSAIGNAKYRSSDGRDMIGFSYVSHDPNYRGAPVLKAVYDGDIPEEPLVSRWDYNEFTRSNIRSRGLSALVTGVGRGAVNVLSDLAAGFYTVGAIANEMVTGEDTHSSTIARIKAWHTSVTDEQETSFFPTLSGTIDFAWDMAIQMLLAYGTGLAAVSIGGKVINAAAGTSKIFGKLLGGVIEASATEATALTNAQRVLLGKLGTGIVYGPMMGYEAREEALRHGFSTRTSDAMALATMVAAGSIFANSNLLPFSRQGKYIERVTSENLKKVIGGELKETMSKVEIQRLATEAVKETAEDAKKISLLFRKFGTYKDKFTDLFKKLARTAEKSSTIGTKVGTGLEEASGIRKLYWEAVSGSGVMGTVAVANAAIKTLWSMPAIVGMGDKSTPHFWTPEDTEFWKEWGAGAVQSILMGAAGGVIGHTITGAVSGGHKLPVFIGESAEDLQKVVYDATSKSDKHAAGVLQTIYTAIDKMSKAGVWASNKLSTEIGADGNLLLVTESKSKKSAAEVYGNMIKQQIAVFAAEAGGVKGTFTEFLEANPQFKVRLASNDMLWTRFKSAYDSRNNALGLNGTPELTASYYGDNPVYTSLEESKSASEKKPKEPKQEKKKTTNATSEKSAETVTNTEEPAAEAQKSDKVAAKKEKDTPYTYKDMVDNKSMHDEAAAIDYTKKLNKLQEDAAQEAADKFKISIESARQFVTAREKLDDLFSGRETENMFMFYSLLGIKDSDGNSLYSVVTKLFSEGFLSKEVLNDNFFRRLMAADEQRLVQDKKDAAQSLENMKKFNETLDKANTFDEIVELINSYKNKESGKAEFDRDTVVALLHKLKEAVNEKYSKKLGSLRVSLYEHYIINNVTKANKHLFDNALVKDKDGNVIDINIPQLQIIQDNITTGIYDAIRNKLPENVRKKYPDKHEDPKEDASYKDMMQDVRSTFPKGSKGDAAYNRFLKKNITTPMLLAYNINNLIRFRVASGLTTLYLYDIKDNAKSAKAEDIRVRKQIIDKLYLKGDKWEHFDEMSGIQYIDPSRFIPRGLGDSNNPTELSNSMKKKMFFVIKKFDSNIISDVVKSVSPDIQGTLFVDAASDLVEMLTRDFDIVDGKIVTSKRVLAGMSGNKRIEVVANHINSIVDLDAASKDKLADELTHSFANKISTVDLMISNISRTQGVEIFNDMKGVKTLLGKLALRQLMAELYTDGEVLSKLSVLSELNAKVHNGMDFFTPISEKDTMAFSKTIGRYIVDPIKYNDILRKFNNKDYKESAEEIKLRNALLIRLHKARIGASFTLGNGMADAQLLLTIAKASQNPALKVDAMRIQTSRLITKYITNSETLNTLRLALPAEGTSGDENSKNYADTKKSIEDKIEALQNAQGKLDKEHKVTDEDLTRVQQAVKALADELYGLDTSIKSHILKQLSGVANSEYITSLLLVNREKFYNDLTNILKEDGITLTFEQETAVLILFTALSTSHEEIYANKSYKNIVRLLGAQGAGKSSVVAPIAMKLVNLADTSGIEGRVAVSAVYKEQIATLANSLIMHGLKVDEKNSIDLFELYAKMQNASEAELVKMFEGINILAIDEATFIQVSDKEGESSDLKSLENKINTINKHRKDKNKLTVILLGDRNQGGYTKGMPTFDKPHVDKVDFTAIDNRTSTNMAKIPLVEIFTTNNLEGEFRYNVSEIVSAIKQARSLAEAANTLNRSIGARDMFSAIHTAYGPQSNQKDLLGGVRLRETEEALWHDNSLAESILKAARQNENFSIAILNKESLADIPDGVVKEALNTIMGNDSAGEFKDNILGNDRTAEFKKSRVNFRDVSTIQGGEFSYVIGSFGEDFLPTMTTLNNKSITDESVLASISRWSTVAMVFGRATDYADVVIDPKVERSSTYTSNIYRLNAVAREDINKVWGKLDISWKSPYSITTKTPAEPTDKSTETSENPTLPTKPINILVKYINDILNNVRLQQENINSKLQDNTYSSTEAKTEYEAKLEELNTEIEALSKLTNASEESITFDSIDAAKEKINDIFGELEEIYRKYSSVDNVINPVESPTDTKNVDRYFSILNNNFGANAVEFNKAALDKGLVMAYLDIKKHAGYTSNPISMLKNYTNDFRIQSDITPESNERIEKFIQEVHAKMLSNNADSMNDITFSLVLHSTISENGMVPALSLKAMKNTDAAIVATFPVKNTKVLNTLIPEADITNLNNAIKEISSRQESMPITTGEYIPKAEGATPLEFRRHATGKPLSDNFKNNQTQWPDNNAHPGTLFKEYSIPKDAIVARTSGRLQEGGAAPIITKIGEVGDRTILSVNGLLIAANKDTKKIGSVVNVITKITDNAVETVSLRLPRNNALNVDIDSVAPETRDISNYSYNYNKEDAITTIGGALTYNTLKKVLTAKYGDRISFSPLISPVAGKFAGRTILLYRFGNGERMESLSDGIVLQKILDGIQTDIKLRNLTADGIKSYYNQKEGVGMIVFDSAKFTLSTFLEALSSNEGYSKEITRGVASSNSTMNKFFSVVLSRLFSTMAIESRTKKIVDSILELLPEDTYTSEHAAANQAIELFNTYRNSTDPAVEYAFKIFEESIKSMADDTSKNDVKGDHTVLSLLDNGGIHFNLDSLLNTIHIKLLESNDNHRDFKDNYSEKEVKEALLSIVDDVLGYTNKSGDERMFLSPSYRSETANENGIVILPEQTAEIFGNTLKTKVVDVALPGIVLDVEKIKRGTFAQSKEINPTEKVPEVTPEPEEITFGMEKTVIIDNVEANIGEAPKEEAVLSVLNSIKDVISPNSIIHVASAILSKGSIESTHNFLLQTAKLSVTEAKKILDISSKEGLMVPYKIFAEAMPGSDVSQIVKMTIETNINNLKEDLNISKIKQIVNLSSNTAADKVQAIIENDGQLAVHTVNGIYTFDNIKLNNTIGSKNELSLTLKDSKIYTTISKEFVTDIIGENKEYNDVVESLNSVLKSIEVSDNMIDSGVVNADAIKNHLSNSEGIMDIIINPKSTELLKVTEELLKMCS